ncbi:MAG: riboflavin synthase [Myxococcota bacterium]
MFTGIVETVGTVASVEHQGELAVLAVDAPAISEGVRIGDSVSVDGGCLTITKEGGGRFEFQAVRETLEKTKLGELRAGSRVNLERALRADARLDGHIVQGHVDGTGRVRSIEREGDDVRLAVDCGADLAEALVEKGSVAIDGVSLTVCRVDDAGFDVALIPHTLEVTTLGQLRPGDRVNLEVDVLGKYVKRYVERILGREARGG